MKQFLFLITLLLAVTSCKQPPQSTYTKKSPEYMSIEFTGATNMYTATLEDGEIHRFHKIMNASPIHGYSQRDILTEYKRQPIRSAPKDARYITITLDEEYNKTYNLIWNNRLMKFPQPLDSIVIANKAHGKDFFVRHTDDQQWRPVIYGRYHSSIFDTFSEIKSEKKFNVRGHESVYTTKIDGQLFTSTRDKLVRMDTILSVHDDYIVYKEYTTTSKLNLKSLRITHFDVDDVTETSVSDHHIATQDGKKTLISPTMTKLLELGNWTFHDNGHGTVTFYDDTGKTGWLNYEVAGHELGVAMGKEAYRIIESITGNKFIVQDSESDLYGLMNLQATKRSFAGPKSRIQKEFMRWSTLVPLEHEDYSFNGPYQSNLIEFYNTEGIGSRFNVYTGKKIPDVIAIKHPS